MSGCNARHGPRHPVPIAVSILEAGFWQLFAPVRILSSLVIVKIR
jgi:hypothetical protein